MSLSIKVVSAERTLGETTTVCLSSDGGSVSSSSNGASLEEWAAGGDRRDTSRSKMQPVQLS